MSRGPGPAARWLVGAGSVLAAGVALILAGTQPPKPVVPVALPVPGAAAPAVQPTGTFVRADSTNTPPALLAALAGTTGGDPAKDRVAVDIPVPDPAPVTPAAPESRLPEPVPDAPIDSVAPPPPLLAQGDSSATIGESVAGNAGGGGGSDSWLVPPVVLKAAWLEYPKEARKRKSEGDVELRILVDEQGGVAAVELERGASDPVLDQAAMAAAHTMRFRPARQSGHPIAVWFNYSFTFRLPG